MKSNPQNDLEQAAQDKFLVCRARDNEVLDSWAIHCRRNRLPFLAVVEGTKHARIILHLYPIMRLPNRRARELMERIENRIKDYQKNLGVNLKRYCGPLEYVVTGTPKENAREVAREIYQIVEDAIRGGI